MPTCRTSADKVLVFVLSINIADRILYGLSSNLWITDLMVKENVLARWCTQIILFIGKTNSIDLDHSVNMPNLPNTQVSH